MGVHRIEPVSHGFEAGESEPCERAEQLVDGERAFQVPGCGMGVHDVFAEW
jgi:hypothetical protein